MKASELRIWNLVKGIGHNIIWTVEGVDNNFIFSSGHWRTITSFEPILLTEELLLKFGFVKEYNTDEGENRDCFYLNNSDDSFYINYDTSYNGWYLGASTYGFLTEIYYVHQLQNLYFALTGTELEIKDEK